MESKKIIIEFDETICKEEMTFERPLAKLLSKALEKINELYDIGHTIILWTSRGLAEFKMTKAWLDRRRFKYRQLLMGKL